MVKSSSRAMVALITLSALCAAHASEPKPGSVATDATAKQLIEWERQWADQACSHRLIVGQILAEDFHGTAPDGSRYDKTQALADDDEKQQHRDCRLLSAEVRYYGAHLAIILGSESAVKVSAAGEEKRTCLAWTDTWLRRNNRWQIVAVQDATFECPKE